MIDGLLVLSSELPVVLGLEFFVNVERNTVMENRLDDVPLLGSDQSQRHLVNVCKHLDDVCWIFALVLILIRLPSCVDRLLLLFSESYRCLLPLMEEVERSIEFLSSLIDSLIFFFA